MSDALPATPPGSTRVDVWEDIDGRRARYFECRLVSRTALAARIVGFQVADGSFHDIQLAVDGATIAPEDLDAAIEDLAGFRTQVLRLTGG